MCRRKSFVLYTDIRTTYQQMTDAEIGRLHRFIAEYNYIDLNNAEEVADFENRLQQDRIISLAFAPIRAQFERDEAKYDSIVEKRRKAGKRGGYAKAGKNPDDDGSKQESSLPVIVETKQPEVDFENTFSQWSQNILEKLYKKQIEEIKKKWNIKNLQLVLRLFKEHIIKNNKQYDFIYNNNPWGKIDYLEKALKFIITDYRKEIQEPISKIFKKNNELWVRQYNREFKLPTDRIKPSDGIEPPSKFHYFDDRKGFNCWREE